MHIVLIAMFLFSMILFAYCIVSVNRKEPWEDDLQEQFLKEWAEEHKKK